MHDELGWIAVDRQDLPMALLQPESQSKSRLRQTIGSGPIQLAFSRPARAKYLPPSLIVLEDDTCADALSWLRTYAPIVAPLSQFSRVLKRSDWDRFSGANLQAGFDAGARTDRWASLVVGEILAQSVGAPEVRDLPLSSANSCFTYALARSYVLHGADASMGPAVDRLRSLEGDFRVADRRAGVADLSFAAGLLVDAADESLDPISAALGIATGIASRSDTRQTQLRLDGAPLDLGDIPDLQSDSVEDRVRAFNRVASDITASSAPTTGDQVRLAAAAFLVGRGTSHAFLLRRLGQGFRPASVWYALLASLSGPASWDEAWTRAAKSVERSVRAGFGWQDSSGVDLFWAEYEWMSSVIEGMPAFIDFPRLQQRAIAVEVLPGATCQVRLAIPDAGSTRAEQVPVGDDAAIRALLRRLVELGAQSSDLLRGDPPPPPNQRARRGGSASSARARRASRDDRANG